MSKSRCTFTCIDHDKDGSITSEIGFGIASLPGRKQKALFVCRGTTMSPVAYFKNEEDAELFHRIFNVWKGEPNRII